MFILVIDIMWCSCDGLFCVGGVFEMGGIDVFDVRYFSVGLI